MTRIGIIATIAGPISSGRADKVLDRAMQEAEEELALQYGITLVAEMGRFFRHPRPYYWTRIDVEKAGTGTVVHDSGVIYGPWLAGIGSRNAVTRFKGYPHWRRTSEKIRRRRRGITIRIVKRYVATL